MYREDVTFPLLVYLKIKILISCGGSSWMGKAGKTAFPVTAMSTVHVYNLIDSLCVCVFTLIKPQEIWQICLLLFLIELMIFCTL